ncbi:hypothetical protein AAEX37_00300 [Oligella sp. MSHR50489EDL]|uniref:hypothetical protein n=1 Tax=Oligella sp. MSHR50489EDL TaxID=3139409 RepID=UPI003D81897C
MKLLTRLREEFAPMTHEEYLNELKQEAEYVSEHAASVDALMQMLEQRKVENELA